ncbi:carbohydrate kinase family protein [Candidatus Latescibacterota bacterium]
MIAAIGISVVDHIMVVNGFNDKEGSFHAEKYIIDGGGMAATALCAASILGSDTRLFSLVGDDLNGRFIVDGLSKYDVDVSCVFALEGKTSAAGVIFVDSKTGEKQFYSERFKSAYTSPVELDVSLIEGADVLLLDGHWIDGSLKGARYAKENGIPVVADFKRMYDGVDTLFQYIDYFIVPEFFAEQITRERTVGKMLGALKLIQPGIPVITQGNSGGVYLDSGKAERYETFDVDVVDSTGAGDAFHGAFCHFLSRGVDFEMCLNLSSAVGALNCRSLGGRDSLPSTEELSRFLRENGVKYGALGKTE